MYISLSERSLVQIERVVEPEQESEYEKMQSSKLRKHFELIQKMDAEIQTQLRERFKSVFKEHGFEVQGRAALCIGSRLGGEVRALQDLGALAVGIDFNPGEKNKHVLYGSATDFNLPRECLICFTQIFWITYRILIYFLGS